MGWLVHRQLHDCFWFSSFTEVYHVSERRQICYWPLTFTRPILDTPLPTRQSILRGALCARYFAQFASHKVRCAACLARSAWCFRKIMVLLRTFPRAKSFALQLQPSTTATATFGNFPASGTDICRIASCTILPKRIPWRDCAMNLHGFGDSSWLSW